MKLKILIASRNRGKIAELHRLLTAYIDGAELELVSLDDVGFTGEIEENDNSFAENAMIKARTAANFSGLISVGDDSGLSVYALDGEPGIYSARYGFDPSLDELPRSRVYLRDGVCFPRRLCRRWRSH